MPDHTCGPAATDGGGLCRIPALLCGFVGLMHYGSHGSACHLGVKLRARHMYLQSAAASQPSCAHYCARCCRRRRRLVQDSCFTLRGRQLDAHPAACHTRVKLRGRAHEPAFWAASQVTPGAALTVLVAAGTDGGGSCRIPASLCGVVGLMPTRQRLPREGQVEGTYTMGCPGVLACSLADAALVYAVIANTGVLFLAVLSHQRGSGGGDIHPWGALACWQIA